MKFNILIFLVLLTGCDEKPINKPSNKRIRSDKETIMYRDLNKEEEHVIINKGTERPFSGKFKDNKAKGVYSCRQCGSNLYKSEDKFDSQCGWPSFDDEIPGAIKRQVDVDGVRTEILCANCGGHLGHVFTGERLTDKNVRHCVNSISMDFTPADAKPQKAYFAGGCFWGVEYYMEKLPGVFSVTSGYMGGHKDNPTYEEVCSGRFGHVEVVEVSYNPYKVTFEELTKRFFEIHDPTQTDGQGPDIGEQYLSVIFYRNEDEKATAEIVIELLEKKGLKVATTLKKQETFWPAEEYHQNYYNRKGTLPYCHGYTKRF